MKLLLRARRSVTAVAKRMRPHRLFLISAVLLVLIGVAGIVTFSFFEKKQNDEPVSFFPNSVGIVMEWRGNSASASHFSSIFRSLETSSAPFSESMNATDRQTLASLANIVGKNAVFGFAIRGKTSSLSEKSTLFVAIRIADEMAFATAMEAWTGGGALTAENGGWSAKEGQFFLKRSGDFLLGASTMTALSEMGKGESVISVFRAASENLPKNRVGTIVFHPSVLEADSTASARAFSNIALGITPDVDGFSFQSIAKGDLKKMALYGVTLNEIKDFSPILINRIATTAPLLFFEGTNFPKMFDIMQNGTGASLLSSLKNGLHAGTGLVWDEKVKPWTNREFAILIGATKTMPTLSFAINAAESPDLAREFLTVIDSFVSIGLLSMGPNGAAFSRGEATIGGGAFTNWTLDPKKLPDGIVSNSTSTILSGLRVAYGVTKDGVFLITTDPDAEGYGDRTVGKNHLVSALQKRVPERNQGLFFVSPKNIALFLSTLSEGIPTLSVAAPQIQTLVSLFMPISGLISANSATKESIIGNGFLQISR